MYESFLFPCSVFQYLPVSKYQISLPLLHVFQAEFALDHLLSARHHCGRVEALFQLRHLGKIILTCCVQDFGGDCFSKAFNSCKLNAIKSAKFFCVSIYLEFSSLEKGRMHCAVHNYFRVTLLSSLVIFSGG